MKILVTVPRNNVGGVANYYRVIKKYFKYDVEYILRGAVQNKKSTIKTVLRLSGDYIIFILKLLDDKKNIILINTSLRANSIKRDLIYIVISRLFGNKIILFIHGWDERYEKTFWKYNSLILSFFKKCDAYLVLSQEVKKKLKDNGVNSSIHLISTVVDDKIFYQKRMPNVNSGSFNILFLSRIEKEKGIFEALQSFELLRKNHNNLHLIIAGDGTKLEEIKKEIIDRDIKGVDVRGYVKGKEKEEIFKKSDIYLFPTYSEGMPTTVLEAMAWGLPIITRPVGGLKDFFEHGKMGYLVQSKNPREIAYYIKNLLKDKTEMNKISKYNIKYAMNNFVASTVVKKIENVFSNLYE